jgi:serine protease Do
MVRNIMEQLVDHGEVIRGYLGVGIQDVTPGMARSLELPGTEGALVNRVVPGDPADDAGMLLGDFIVRVGEEPVDSSNELRNVVAALEPGETVEIEVIREGEPASVEVTIGEQPEEWSQTGTQYTAETDENKLPGRYGLNVEESTDALAEKFGYEEPPAGVIVVEVEPDSNAAEEGITPGTAILRVGRTPTTTVQDFLRALEQQAETAEEDGVTMIVTNPSGVQRFVLIAPGEE